MINFPRREKAAAKVGPRLEISPLEMKGNLKKRHGLSSLLTAAASWEPFAWKGNTLSAPLRALFAAEARGLLENKNTSVAIADIAAEINNFLISIGKKPIAESTVLSNLKSAALYLNAAVNVTIVPDNKTMTVRVLGELETQENIVKYFDEIQGKLNKLNLQVEHAQACGYDVSRVLSAEQVEGAKRLVAAN